MKMQRKHIIYGMALVGALGIGFLSGRAKSKDVRTAPQSAHWSGPIVVRQVRDELHTDVILDLVPFKVILHGQPRQLGPAPEGAVKAYMISFPEAGVQVLATDAGS